MGPRQGSARGQGRCPQLGLHRFCLQALLWARHLLLSLMTKARLSLHQILRRSCTLGPGLRTLGSCLALALALGQIPSRRPALPSCALKAAVASLFGPQPSPKSPQDQRTTQPLAEPHCPLVVATHSCIEALTRVHSASPCMEQLYKQHESHNTGTTIDGP